MTQQQTNQIKTIDINCKEWFDKAAANSYFAGTVTVNFGLSDQQTINLHFQYGYEGHYKEMAFKALENSGIITDREHYSNGASEAHWRYCERKGIVLRASIQTGCKKKELLTY